MKSCTIYKTFKNEYKIVSQCETTAGYLLDVTPVYILSTDSPNDVLMSSFLNALNNSTKVIKAPERSEFPLVQKKLLANLKEVSFSKLYMNSSSCSIRVENNTMTIYPNKLMTEGQPKDGLVWVREDKVVIEEYASNLDMIILKIKEMLDRTY